MADNYNEEKALLRTSSVMSSGSYFPEPALPDEKKPDGKTSVLGAAFIVSNAALGAGLLAMPYAFWSAGGVISGLLIEAVSARQLCVIDH